MTQKKYKQILINFLCEIFFLYINPYLILYRKSIIYYNNFLFETQFFYHRALNYKNRNMF